MSLKNTPTPIYTIGYGNRSIEVFITWLKVYGIEYLVDVRSQPYSRYNIDFKKKALEEKLPQHGIHYLYLGHQIGGMPTDPTCRLPNGKVNYEAVQEKDFFQAGIARLVLASQKSYTLALMCAELKAPSCHRYKLIAPVLLKNQIPVLHIDEKGQIQAHPITLF